MVVKYNISFSNQIIKHDLKRIVNQVYKLLPTREQGSNWQKPLQTVIEELVGMKSLFLDRQEQTFFILLCKLEGLKILTERENFNLYRRTIFECLSLLGEIGSCLNQME